MAAQSSVEGLELSKKLLESPGLPFQQHSAILAQWSELAALATPEALSQHFNHLCGVETNKLQVNHVHRRSRGPVAAEEAGPWTARQVSLFRQQRRAATRASTIAIATIPLTGRSLRGLCIHEGWMTGLAIVRMRPEGRDVKKGPRRLLLCSPVSAQVCAGLRSRLACSVVVRQRSREYHVLVLLQSSR